MTSHLARTHAYNRQLQVPVCSSCFSRQDGLALSWTHVCWVPLIQGDGKAEAVAEGWPEGYVTASMAVLHERSLIRRPS